MPTFLHLHVHTEQKKQNQSHSLWSPRASAWILLLPLLGKLCDLGKVTQPLCACFLLPDGLMKVTTRRDGGMDQWVNLYKHNVLNNGKHVSSAGHAPGTVLRLDTYLLIYRPSLLCLFYRWGDWLQSRSVIIGHSGDSHHHHHPASPQPPALLPGLGEAGSRERTNVSQEGASSLSSHLSRWPEKSGWWASGVRGSRRRNKEEGLWTGALVPGVAHTTFSCLPCTSNDYYAR